MGVIRMISCIPLLGFLCVRFRHFHHGKDTEVSPQNNYVDNRQIWKKIKEPNSHFCQFKNFFNRDNNERYISDLNL